MIDGQLIIMKEIFKSIFDGQVKMRYKRAGHACVLITQQVVVAPILNDSCGC